ncbi:GAF domain-containing protein [Cesiribacter sp. SM1]|uniref:PAS domain-containing protein n=1 Tax=Cesiribacter sp. SM1 TaxID=2861196 RepID=UPI001CD1F035|nr:GAF domain-containing protein [Cesiribacter sp. SM1]
MLSFLKTVLRLNSIKGNIVLALIAMGSITLLLIGFNFWISEQLNNSRLVLHQQLQPLKSSVARINSNLNKSMLLISVSLATESSETTNDWRELWEYNLQPDIEEINVCCNHTVNAKLSNDINLLSEQIKEIYDAQHQFLTKLQQRNSIISPADATPVLTGNNGVKALNYQEMSQLNSRAEALMSLLTTNTDQQIEDEQQKQQEYLDYLSYVSLSLLALCFLAGVGLAYYLVAQVTRSLYRIRRSVKELSAGNIPAVIEQSRNETSQITHELSKLTEHLRAVQEFAVQVGQGKFDNEVEVFNRQGELGKSLAGMRDSLFKVAKEDQQRNWVNEGFTLFGDILRTHNSSINALCDAFISNLVKYVGANHGAIFVTARSETQQQDVLTMVSSYAYDRKKYLQKEILLGEGLCGQAWQEQSIIHIDDVPEEYVQVRSGLGGANPTEVLVVPLITNEQVQGVLEMASFKSLEPHQVEFISKIAENLAAAVASTRTNEKTHLLLEKFQEMTEELRAQEEEMRQNMEELQATQEEMSRAKSEIERKEHNLNSVINNTPDTIFALDEEYRITVVNKVLSDKYRGMGIILEEGTLIKDVLPKSAWEVWKPRYDRALAGEQYSIVQESSGAVGKRYSQTYHNPIRNENGNIVGVSVISRDVTDTVLAQQEADFKRFIVNSLIDNTDDTYFAIDCSYKILIANKTLRERYAQSNISLEEGDNIFDKLPADQHASWKDRYDRALAGESFVMVTERPLKDKVLTIEVHHQPIIDAGGKVIGAIVSSKDITRWKAALAGKDETKQQDLGK